MSKTHRFFHISRPPDAPLSNKHSIFSCAVREMGRGPLHLAVATIAGNKQVIGGMCQVIGISYEAGGMKWEHDMDYIGMKRNLFHRYETHVFHRPGSITCFIGMTQGVFHRYAAGPVS